MLQLHCRDLSAGDIMLKMSDNSFTSKLITFGQKLTRQLNSSVVHAGVMFDNTYIIESQGPGVSANDLRMANKGKGYIVYRPTAVNLGQGAGVCAKMMFDIHQTHGSLKYTIPGAIRSLFGARGQTLTPMEMDGLLSRILEGRNQPYFCSQFVVYVYQFVAEQNGVAAATIFNLQDSKASPSMLASVLQNNLNFNELGYMLPGER